jgi:acyl-CoA synthetase (AMP-forming)/AMP-acid ligase II/3-hydroxymyristoyl/3-hydroxydecanoyl-(acyl carrier protein) dehydratase
MIALADILNRLYVFKGTVVQGRETTTSGREFAIATHHFAQTLEARLESRWGLHMSSTHDFALAFLALLSADKDILLIPNTLPGMLDEVAERIEGFVLDLPAETELPTLGLPPTPTAVLPFSSAPITERPGRITFYTSGTSGQGKAIPKTLSQLEREASDLEAIWGESLKGTLAVSTVSHQHIYGFLFRFLWPLLAGRPFLAEPLPLLQDLAPLIRTLGPCAFVSCPAHLRRLPDLSSLRECSPALRQVYSSGGPLGQDTALRLEADLGHAPIEVFGSTETGGVAHRQRSAKTPEPSWALFPEVRINIAEHDQSLSVCSPFAGDDGWVAMGDQVERIDETHFTLLGRTDRVVKVEQKRVTLDQMEAHLIASPLVSDAGLVLLTTGGHRDLLGAAICLSEAGNECLASNDRKRVVQNLKAQLAAYYEPVTIPRKWIIVDELPRNTQGKLPARDLEDLFMKERPWKPVISHCQVGANAARIKGRVPEDLRFFDGHFDEIAIVAGVVQLHWVLALSEELFGIEPEIERMDAVKFHSLMLSDEHFDLDMKWDAEQRKLTFSFYAEDKKFSSGRMLFRS